MGEQTWFKMFYVENQEWDRHTLSSSDGGGARGGPEGGCILIQPPAVVPLCVGVWVCLLLCVCFRAHRASAGQNLAHNSQLTFSCLIPTPLGGSAIFLDQ